VLELAQRTGIGAQFGGKYFCHDVRIVRLPRHGASCPVAMAVSCSADRQAKGKITRDGVFLEQLERDPARFLPTSRRPSRRQRRRRAHRPRPADGGDPSPSCRGIRCGPRVMLTGPMVVARDIAHAKIKERLDARRADAAVLARPLRVLRGPAKTPEGYASGSFGRRRRGGWTATSTSSRPPAGRW
jgi:fumarate hydratase class I